MVTTNKTTKAPVKKKISRKLSVKSRVSKSTKIKKDTKKGTKNIVKKKVSKKTIKKVPFKKKIRVIDKTSNKHTLDISTSRIQLAMLSPLKFPVNYNHIATQTARVAGLTFVIVGAIFAVLNLQIVNSSYSTLSATDGLQQLATIVCTNPDDPKTCDNTPVLNGGLTYSCDDPNNPEYYSADICGYTDGICDDIRNPEYDSTVCDMNYEPPVIFSTDSTGALSGRVIIKYSVNDAERLKAVVFYNDTREYIELGRATNVDADTWEFVWDTTQYPDGKYKLKAIVMNLNGRLYDYSDDSYVFIENNSQTTESEPAGNDVVTEEPVNTEDSSILIDDIENDEEILAPEIDLFIEKTGVLGGYVDVFISVDSADAIELYVIPNFSLTSRFIGLARENGNGKWRFRFNTTQTPNGNYEIFARVKNNFGVYDSDKLYILIFNEIKMERTFEEKLYVKYTEEADDYVNELNDTEFGIAEDDAVPEARHIPELIEERIVPTTEKIFEDREMIDDDSKIKAEEILKEFKVKLRVIIDEMAIAERNNDIESIEEMKKRIEELRQQVFSKISDLDFPIDLMTEINVHMEEVSNSLERVIKRNEEIISDRAGDAVFEDSDSDGISDYDEINIYKTDPFSADTDGDGFTDGIEIQGGYNPTDDSPEAFVKYESPKNLGVVREDILTVESITTIKPDSDDTSNNIDVAQAMISGKGLPNSFVTLYIFSTTVVVSVKTKDDGSWSYIFDKELEDGEHEIYAAVTDNAGRIVAKSNPLTFVKTAEAFTQKDVTSVAAVTPVEPGSPNILSENILLIALSLIVVALGLILILIGMHIQTTKPKIVIN